MLSIGQLVAELAHGTETMVGYIGQLSGYPVISEYRRSFITARLPNATLFGLVRAPTNKRERLGIRTIWCKHGEFQVPGPSKTLLTEGGGT